MTWAATEKQKHAIEHFAGPMLVVAGAGSGKTTVLVERIAHLIGAREVAPESIHALTFNDNAARNIRERVRIKLGAAAAERLQARTFHSYCADLLRRYGKDFKVIDETDLEVYLRLHVRELPLRLFVKAVAPARFISDLLRFNARCQDDLISAQDYRSYVSRLEADATLPLPRIAKSKDSDALNREDVLARCREIADVYSFVDERLRQKGWGTYGQMITGAVELLRDPEILAQEQARARFVVIDEFQDSNYAQIELAQLLAGGSANIFAVGDPDQGVYQFRGASNEAFDEFRRRFPQTANVTLDLNYRSVPEVLKVAYAVISKNTYEGRLPLISARAMSEKLSPEEQQVISVPDDATEAKVVVDVIEARKKAAGASWSDFAVLYRGHKHRDALVNECMQRSVPHYVTGVSVLGSPEVRDLLAAIHATVIVNDAVSLFRLAALPQFGIKPELLQFVLAGASRGRMMEDLLLEVPEGKKLLAALERARKQISEAKLTAIAAVDVLIQSFNVADSAARAAFRAFVREWQEKPVAEVKSLAAFCEYFDVFAELGKKVCLPQAESDVLPDGIRLMTIHAAKGLEFKHVSVIRVNQGAFPTNFKEPLFEFPQALSPSASFGSHAPKELHVEEERRLFYVALTRAKDSLALYGKTRSNAKYSGYLKELGGNKQLADVIKLREITETRVDIHASTAPLTPMSAWLAMPSKPPSGKLALSATALESYDTCPLRYHIEYDWRVPGELAAATQYGSVVHTVLRAYYDAVKAGRKLELDAVLDCFLDAIKNAKIADRHQLGLYTEQGIRSLTVFVKSHADLPSPKVLATEKLFEFDLGEVRIKGRIDRIDELPTGAVAVEDYKTGSPKTDDHAKKSMQLTVYALAMKSEGKKAEKLSLYSLEDDSTAFTERSAEDLVAAEEKIAEIAAGIRQGAFDPTPGHHCTWCPYTSLCPAKEERLFQITKAAGTIQ